MGVHQAFDIADEFGSAVESGHGILHRVYKPQVDQDQGRLGTGKRQGGGDESRIRCITNNVINDDPLRISLFYQPAVPHGSAGASLGDFAEGYAGHPGKRIGGRQPRHGAVTGLVVVVVPLLTGTRQMTD